jgi:lysophospholipase L1-like esterase
MRDPSAAYCDWHFYCHNFIYEGSQKTGSLIYVILEKLAVRKPAHGVASFANRLIRAPLGTAPSHGDLLQWHFSQIERFTLLISSRNRNLPGLWFCLLISLVAACGGDRYDKIRNIRSAGQTIICFGDSLTEGVGAGSGEDYPSVLSRLLVAPVINAGRRGDTSAQALGRLSDAVSGRSPRLVIVLLGGNDFLRQVPREQTRKNLEEIVSRIQAEGAMAAIAGMRLGLFTDEFGSIFEETAEKFGALYIPRVTNGILNDSSLRSDPIHPNGAGYRLIAERIAEKIMPLLREADRLRGPNSAG